MKPTLLLAFLLLLLPAAAAEPPSGTLSGAPGASAALGAIHYRLASVHDDRTVGEGTARCSLELHLFGPGARQATAARVVLTSVTDDANDVLDDSGNSGFVVFSQNGNRRALFLGVSTPSRAAKFLSVSGRFELFVPALDPDATVDVADLPSKYGTELDSPALRKAGVQISFPNRAAPEQSAPDGSSMRNSAGYRLTPTDLALDALDPDERVVELDVFDSKGVPLSRGRSVNTQHGWKHIVLHLPKPLTGDMHLICRLLTEHALTSVPFRLNDIALP